ncbi:hypothetical protein K3722_15330 [Leisingera caerulea]|uniref:Uncharacterized protein n=1 Tax=Leisingera caerulea TaxID=506591 RepID=A0A9Q9HEF1_LEICA|nr:hypothetical protein [Leisingera caerulea]UWQ53268.1 hypothetical protein K3721_14920 [Leisingera caerulea]UWQ57848.1 hypothetical protein K3722_15330 [Leisingera caerulea]
MAWVSSVIGAIGGLGLMLAAVFLGGWPVWLAVVVYPFTAAVLALVLIAPLSWRRSRRKTSSGRHSAKIGKTPDKPQELGQRPF